MQSRLTHILWVVQSCSVTVAVRSQQPMETGGSCKYALFICSSSYVETKCKMEHKDQGSGKSELAWETVVGGFILVEIHLNLKSKDFEAKHRIIIFAEIFDSKKQKSKGCNKKHRKRLIRRPHSSDFYEMHAIVYIFINIFSAKCLLLLLFLLF